MSARILIHVQHLLGTGHLKRAVALGSALARAGFSVEIVSGGTPLADLATGGATLFQLPALRAVDVSFKTLVDERGRVIDDTWRSARRDALLRRFAEFQPDVLITELFPFGRRMLEFELLPLLEAARARGGRPLILSSVRDILIAPRELEKSTRAIERARTMYDRVLVHGDPALIGLPASYPAAATLGERLVYTGYVTAEPGPDAPPGDGEDEVIVSSGGGAVGAHLLETAVAAQAQLADGRRWRLLIGGDVPPEARMRIMAAAGPRLIVEPARRDFGGLLRRCHVSVSQAGYNTVMDILVARTPAVLVPFAAAGETEQSMRAEAVARRDWAELLIEDRLTAATLAEAVRRAAARGRPDTIGLRYDGAAETVQIVRDLVARTQAVA